MNYSEPLVSQVTVFFRSVGCGIMLGTLYDAVCLVRMLFGERKSVYIFFDTAYFLSAAIISFFFMVLYNSGQIRFNLMLAELAGAVVFHFSLGKYILEKYARQLSHIRKISFFLIGPFLKVCKKIQSTSEKLCSERLKKASEKKNTEKYSKKICNIIKIPLKNKNKSV